MAIRQFDAANSGRSTKSRNKGRHTGNHRLGVRRHLGGFEPPTFGLEARSVHAQLQTVNGNLGPLRDHFQSLGVALLGDVVAGRAVRRRDAVAIARMVLESAAVRAAESLLEADDAELLPWLTALLEEVLVPATAHTSLEKAPSS
jgi:hypothetical protein